MKGVSGKFFFQVLGMVPGFVGKIVKKFQVQPISANWPISAQLANISKSKEGRDSKLCSLDRPFNSAQLMFHLKIVSPSGLEIIRLIGR